MRVSVRGTHSIFYIYLGYDSPQKIIYILDMTPPKKQKKIMLPARELKMPFARTLKNPSVSRFCSARKRLGISTGKGHT
jgi:hypothetical protein